MPDVIQGLDQGDHFRQVAILGRWMFIQVSTVLSITYPGNSELITFCQEVYQINQDLSKSVSTSSVLRVHGKYGRRQKKLCVPFRTDEYETVERIVPFSSFFRPSVAFCFVLFLRKRTVLINAN